MDETAITLCKENCIPVKVFNLSVPGNILRALTGDPDIGTTVDEGDPESEDLELPSEDCEDLDGCSIEAYLAKMAASAAARKSVSL